MLVEPDNQAEVIERFANFYDSVVVDVRLMMRASPKVCVVTLQCMDRDSPSGWSDVTLTVRNVHEFRFQLDRTTFEVLSSGLQFTWSDRRLYVVLDAYPDDGPGLPDLARNIAYVAGSECTLEATPYIPPGRV